jgi:hypothetical protein
MSCSRRRCFRATHDWSKSAVLSVIFRLYVAFAHPAWACVATLCALHFCFLTVLTRISACSRFSSGPRVAHARHAGAAWPRDFFFLMSHTPLLSLNLAPHLSCPLSSHFSHPSLASSFLHTRLFLSSHSPASASAAFFTQLFLAQGFISLLTRSLFIWLPAFFWVYCLSALYSFSWFLDCVLSRLSMVLTLSVFASLRL